MKLRFVDSFRFLASSLDKLSETLKSDQCKEVRKHFPNEKEFRLIRRKGVFPYTYVESFEKLNETWLPSKECFYDNLKGEPISDEDYRRASEVWTIFKCTTLGSYSDVYLKSDVLLLADIFENFRKVCLNQYNLDPAHYLTAPSLSWDAMLRYTKIELELLTDIDMVHFFKKAIRGGVSQCSKRKVVANNPFVANYDPLQPNAYIMYLDATNLYGAAMSNYLPTGGFKWLENCDNFDCCAIADDSFKGYVLEVDLDYPPNLHNIHNDLPFCPEPIKTSNSQYTKLMPNLYDKKKYIIHYRNLKQCLKNGLQLVKIHRVLEFFQSPWLKTYIDLNTNLRNSSKTEFERDLFKLLVNSIFGKTMENVDKRQDIRLLSHWENMKQLRGVKSYIDKPNFKTCSIFEENLVAVHMERLRVVYDKPLYVGFCILDLSKTVIYQFFYDYIKPMYKDDVTLCYTDTDSLILEINTDNVYNDIKNNISYFDTSNYPIDNIHGIPKTQSVIGKMKDEFKGVPVESFIGTGAKAYCVKLSNSNLLKKAKGISKNVIKHQLQLSDYIQVIKDKKSIHRKMYVFSSHSHTIYTELKNKISLSSSDDKRVILPDNVHTLALGHFLTRRNLQGD
ncbi:uncharacterized protein LOC126891446 [Diabrotica virgifera virgifera]|uniref:DNA-directed DNA polymerase n=1 Tax=Diabrotica virgifera virgifera TaxID=50390 RepID=A0ABM5L2B5_DIAVI|nr:uncharacterized protein LOC126891446 [Diabrotica virgifera virgifera]